MTLFLSLLPLYIFGNLHCLGMCGPLVLMLGQHQYRYFYFAGRLASFSLAGFIAGEMGAVIQVFFKAVHFPAMASFLFGTAIVWIGISTLLGWQYTGTHWLAEPLAKINQKISLLLLQDRKWPTFLFGFLTIALPCGQSLIVFSACALSGSALIGLFNGFAFALLTSPSLYLAMKARTFLNQLKRYYNMITGGCAILVGMLALFRALADLEYIPHLSLNSHIVVY